MKLSSTCLCLGALASSAAVQAVHIPDQQQDSTVKPRVLGFPIQRNRVSNVAVRDAKRRLRRRAGHLEADLTNESTLYFLNASIGTPAQSFRLQLDTGSSDFWINTDSSDICQRKGNPCSLAGTFVANDSSTYQYLNSAFSIKYQDGSGASGDYGTDTLHLGGEDIKDFEFAIGYQSTAAQNVAGIGYAIIEADDGTSANLKPYDNLPAKLAEAGVIASNAYSLWLNDLSANTGSILFGGIDREQYSGDLVTLPINKEHGGYYEFLISLTDVTLGGGSSLLDNGDSISVLLDSGTSLTYLPDDTVRSIYDAVHASWQTEEELATVPCSLANSDTELTYRFDDKISINVPMNELVLPAVQVTDEDGSANSDNTGALSDICIFGIAPAGDTDAVLGDTFLRSAYVVYDIDNNEISLAQSFMNATKTDIVEIGTGSKSVPSDRGDASASESESDSDSAAAGVNAPVLVAVAFAMFGSVAFMR